MNSHGEELGDPYEIPQDFTQMSNKKICIQSVIQCRVIQYPYWIQFVEPVKNIHAYYLNYDTECRNTKNMVRRRVSFFVKGFIDGIPRT